MKLCPKCGRPDHAKHMCVSVEDAADRKAAGRALKDYRKHGGVPLEEIKRDLAQSKRRAEPTGRSSLNESLARTKSDGSGFKKGSKPLLLAKGLEAAPRAGRPRIEETDKTIEAAAPWRKLGMSRRTWYRRQAEQRAKEKQ